MPKCTCDDFCDSPCPEHATDEERAAWNGGLGDLNISPEHPTGAIHPVSDTQLPLFVPTAAEGLIGERLKKWHSAVDARAVQIALMLTAEEYAAFVERNELPADYLTRNRYDYEKVPGIGKLLADQVPNLDLPFTLESLVEQYEPRAKEVHRRLGWFEEYWRGLAELWAITDLEIGQIVMASHPTEPPEIALRHVFHQTERGKLPAKEKEEP